MAAYDWKNNRNRMVENAIRRSHPTYHDDVGTFFVTLPLVGLAVEMW